MNVRSVAAAVLVAATALSAPAQQADRDASIRIVAAPAGAFPGERVNVRLMIRSHGYPGASVQLRILLGEAEAATASVTLAEGRQFLDMPFLTPKDARGPLTLTAALPELPGEASAANNRVSQPLRIVDRKIKVFYIEGKPRWEFRHLRNILAQDARVDLKIWMTEGDEDLPKTSPQYVNGFPAMPEAASYDLVILGEVPAWKITDAMPRLVALVKERGLSLLVIAGDRYTPFSYAGTPVADLLPVTMSSPADHVEVGPEVCPAVTALGKGTFVMLDSDEKAAEAAWALVRPLGRVPGLEGAKAGRTSSSSCRSRLRGPGTIRWWPGIAAASAG